MRAKRNTQGVRIGEPNSPLAELNASPTVSAPVIKISDTEQNEAKGGMLPKLTIERRLKFAFVFYGLRANWLAIALLPLACITAFRTTLLFIDRNAVIKAVELYNAEHPYEKLTSGWYDTNIAYGYATAFAFLIIGGMGLADRKKARWVTTLPFVVLASLSAIFAIKEVVFGTPSHAIGAAFVGIMLPLLIASFFWDLAYSPEILAPQRSESGPPEGNRGANSRYAEGRNPDIQQEDY